MVGRGCDEYLPDIFSQFGQQPVLVIQLSRQVQFVPFLIESQLFPDVQHVIDAV